MKIARRKIQTTLLTPLGRRFLYVGTGVVSFLLLVFTVIPAASGMGAPAEVPAPEPTPGAAVITAAPVPLSVISAPPSLSPSPAPKEPEWPLILVNGDHPVPEEYDTSFLIMVDQGTEKFDSRAAGALQSMLDDMRAQGLSPLICSAYRSRELQAELFESKVARVMSAEECSREQAEQTAPHWVARPGTSEHETGLAVDIVASAYQVLEEEQEGTAEQKWLFAHSAEYGFVLRYPREKSEITGIGYEPWHYRYVGLEAAREMSSKGLCLEEYLAEKYDKK